MNCKSNVLLYKFRLKYIFESSKWTIRSFKKNPSNSSTSQKMEVTIITFRVSNASRRWIVSKQNTKTPINYLRRRIIQDWQVLSTQSHSLKSKQWFWRRTYYQSMHKGPLVLGSPAQRYITKWLKNKHNNCWFLRNRRSRPRSESWCKNLHIVCTNFKHFHI